MYNIIKDLIDNKNYQLVDMIAKINKLWIEYQLTDEQRDELIELANANVDVDNEKPELQQQIETLSDYIRNTLEPRIKALEDGQVTETPVEEEYPKWKKYNAVTHLGYNYGDKVTHNGFKWINMLQGMKNIWEPGADGIDERYWKKIEE